MNFKIEFNYINIDNYPSMERHFERRAREGWLISRVLEGYVFFYKRIEPEDLDFSISPYEVETFFTRKTKAELAEFQDASQHVGWTFAGQALDLHIYYKKKTEKAIPMDTDEEELFKTLESIGKKQEKSIYILLLIHLFLSWFILGGLLNNIYAIKDGPQVLLALIIPMGLFFSIVQIRDINSFLNKNKKNLDEGLALDFKERGQNVYRVFFTCLSLFFLLFLIQIFYSGLILKNRILIMGLFPTLLGVSIGGLYRAFIKPKKLGMEVKLLAFLLALLIIIPINTFAATRFFHVFYERESPLPNPQDYRYISFADWNSSHQEEDGVFLENASLLIPQSYEYTSYSRGIGFIRTEYSRALSEGLAHNLVKRYMKQAKNAFIGRTGREIEASLFHKEFDTSLKFYGIDQDDFEKARDLDSVSAKKILREIGLSKSIFPLDEKDWQVDEGYYLNFRKEQLVLRKGKEVFFLEGLDFTDKNNIEIIKNRLKI